MRFIQDEIVEDKYQEVWYNKDGQEIVGENEKFFAKTVTREGNPTYYIREYAGSLFNPEGMHKRKKFHNDEIRMVRVSKAVFDFYMLFLQTKHAHYLTKAERGRTNG